jgi:regulator of sigma E protease
MIVEAIRGKRVPPDKEGWVHGIGMILLLALMAFVMFNDVKKLF